MAKRTLYIVACSAPPASDVHKLVDIAHGAGWNACVIGTPMAQRFLDISALAERTGFPVRIEYKQPDEPDVLPTADAIIAAPVTFNTVNKWAAGISDTLATGILNESIGWGTPMTAVPFVNSALAAHPAYRASLERLREYGVGVIGGTNHAPRTGGGHALAAFPWQAAFDAVAARVAAG